MNISRSGDVLVNRQRRAGVDLDVSLGRYAADPGDPADGQRTCVDDKDTSRTAVGLQLADRCPQRLIRGGNSPGRR